MDKKISRIKVRLGRRSYNIFVGTRIMASLDKFIPAAILKNPVLVVTNKRVRKLLGADVRRAFARLSGGVSFKEIPDGEAAKTISVYMDIVGALASIGRKAKPLLVALGGGVTGDVSGFAAATYRRGIPYMQVPTTLLAQVDSAIGGKVAIDLPSAKNLVGSFYQPCAVVSDLAVLSSLPEKEIRNGLAEIIKYAVIKDAQLFGYLEKNIDSLLALKPAALLRVVTRCAAIKAGVVSTDEYDRTGVRMALNFGHTFGHAVEAAFGYSKKYTHGEAVAIGMAMACSAAVDMKTMDRKSASRVLALIERAGLPMRVKGSSVARIAGILDYDKKFSGGRNCFVLPVAIGRVRLFRDVPDSIIRNNIKKRWNHG